MWGWFLRYRGGKGFGIHSPFAFRFVTEVIEEPCPYYDYDKLPATADRLIYRIAAFAQPQVVRTVGDTDGKPAFMACPRAQKWKGESWQLAVVKGDTDPAALMAGQDDDCIVVVTAASRQCIRDFKAWMAEHGYGMLFTNDKNIIVAVCRRKLPQQNFAIRIK